MTAIEQARAVLPENHEGWDCDGSASICDRRVDALRALIAEYERMDEELSEAHTHFAIQEGRIRALIAEHERLSAPPSDDEREALDQIMREADGCWPDAREAILATFRRQGPITDEWEYGNQQLMHSRVEVVPAASEAVARAQAWLWPLYRRRPAGPWEPVPSPTEQESDR